MGLTTLIIVSIFSVMVLCLLIAITLHSMNLKAFNILLKLNLIVSGLIILTIIVGAVLVVQSGVNYKLTNEYEIVELEDYEGSYIIKGVKDIPQDEEPESVIYEETVKGNGEISLRYKDEEEMSELNLTNDNVINLIIHKGAKPELVVSSADEYEKDFFNLISIDLPDEKKNKYEIVIPE